MTRQKVNPWHSIPNVLEVSDRQRGDIRTAQRIRKYLYSDATVTAKQKDAASRVLRRHGATDVAEMLGLA